MMISSNPSAFDREHTYQGDFRPTVNRVVDVKEEGMEFDRSTNKHGHDESSSKVESAEKRDSVVSLQDNGQGFKGL